jgi:sucrose-6-phosphate hydrolase SacC (GH32 family)
MSPDEWRPRYHFTPPANWMNDPNGLLFDGKQYHLFYQHNPYSAAWGHMTWGHAVSPDLVHWANLPNAIHEDIAAGYTIFSGSAVLDRENTSGLGDPATPSTALRTGPGGPIVAIYTADYVGPPRLEDVHIAFSNDGGLTFTQFAGNPVIHVGDPKFGDPKVFWHAESRQWIMVNILHHDQGRVVIYGSPNLRKWRQLSGFDAAEEAPGVWECPDLFPLALDGDPAQTFWVLKVNDPHHPQQFHTRYFLGDFDGQTFRRHASLPAITPEIGPNYAEVTYNGIPPADGRRILIGWIRQKPSDTRAWTGMQCIPRVLTLRSSPAGPRLCQAPVAEMAGLRGKYSALPAELIAGDGPSLAQHGLRTSELEIEATFEPGDAAECGFRLHLGDDHEAAAEATVGWAAGTGRLFIRLPGQDELALPLQPTAGRISLHLFVDRGIVEVFGGMGEATLTALLEPTPVCADVRPYAVAGEARLTMLRAWELASAWSSLNPNWTG